MEKTELIRLLGEQQRHARGVSKANWETYFKWQANKPADYEINWGSTPIHPK